MIGFFALVILIFVAIPLSAIFGLYYRFRYNSARNYVIIICVLLLIFYLFWMQKTWMNFVHLH
ncbi:hypothetical protein CDW55_01935 [Chryseobacterium sp. VAUSW3]|nr:hypothetical protein CDW55_01935 [Chryseobacterium sp. VAUSW3]